jgi:hypothetical protein
MTYNDKFCEDHDTNKLFILFKYTATVSISVMPELSVPISEVFCLCFRFHIILLLSVYYVIAVDKEQPLSYVKWITLQISRWRFLTASYFIL